MYFLSEDDYDYLAKGIAVGAVIGIFIGICINNIILAFSICTVVGMTFSLIRSLFNRIKNIKRHL